MADHIGMDNHVIDWEGQNQRLKTCERNLSGTVSLTRHELEPGGIQAVPHRSVE